MTEQEFVDLKENNGGVCLACTERADGCEPDARNYRCDFCDKKQVFGVEELLIMGEIDIIAESKLDKMVLPEVKDKPLIGGLNDPEALEAMRYVFDPYAGWVETKTDKKVAELRNQWKGEMAD